jgi:AraC family transcriptional regulator
MFDMTAGTFGIVAAHLVEAACGALEGDGETVKARIARVVALLQGELGAGIAALQSRNKARQADPRGGLTAWQARRVTAHIDANLSGKIHVDALADLVGLSAGHFSREFKRSFGVTPHTYVVRRRIEVAQSLMLTTRDSLSDIALSCGMSDQPHFTRSFRRVVGETPDSWRRSRRDAIAGRSIGLALHPVIATVEG